MRNFAGQANPKLEPHTYTIQNARGNASGARETSLYRRIMCEAVAKASRGNTPLVIPMDQDTEPTVVANKARRTVRVGCSAARMP